MMTPTHLLIASAAFSRSTVDRSKEQSRSLILLNIMVIIGALLPDVSIYILYLWAKFVAGLSSHTVWTQTYWQEPWQTLSAISNSIPLYLSLLLLGLGLKWRWLWVLASAALLHLMFDLPFHNSDAHKHFWPLTDYRFHSPLSYWNAAHYGDFVAILERLVAVICIILLWRRFSARWVRALLVLGVISYVAVPLYFWFSLS